MTEPNIPAEEAAAGLQIEAGEPPIDSGECGAAALRDD